MLNKNEQFLVKKNGLVSISLTSVYNVSIGLNINGIETHDHLTLIFNVLFLVMTHTDILISL